jgi:hypothetical protein
MTITPYFRLFIGSERVVAVSGGHIYVLNTTYVLRHFSSFFHALEKQLTKVEQAKSFHKPQTQKDPPSKTKLHPRDQLLPPP